MPLFSELLMWVSQSNITCTIEKTHVFHETLCQHKMTIMVFPSLKHSTIWNTVQYSLWNTVQSQGWNSKYFVTRKKNPASYLASKLPSFINYKHSVWVWGGSLWLYTLPCSVREWIVTFQLVAATAAQALSWVHLSGGTPQWIFVYFQGQVQTLALIYSVWQFLLLGS